METPTETTPTSYVPKSPELPGSTKIVAVITKLASTPPKKYKKKIARKIKATPSAVADKGNTDDDVASESESSSDKKEEEEAKEEPAKEEGEDAQEAAEENEEEDQADEVQAEKEKSEEEEGKGSAAKETSSSTLPPPRKRTRAETKLPTPPPKRRATVSSGKPPKSSFTRPPTRQVVRVKVFDNNLLKILGVYEGVRNYFTAIGWSAFLDSPGTVYPLLAREFVQSLEAKPLAKIKLTTDCIKFKLLGESYSFSLNELNCTLGMTQIYETKTDAYKQAFTMVPEQSGDDWNQKWKEVSVNEAFKTGYSKGHELKDGALRMCHRLIAYSFYGKVDSNNSISQQELFILWCMAKGYKVNFVAFAVAHFKDILSHQR